jgi:uncharacterized protein
VHLLVGTFVSTKFMSIFAFLFGLGAALQYRSIRAAWPGASGGDDGPPSPAPAAADSPAAWATAVYRRRLRFLLAVGVAHGVLLYYGDILAFYALCGLLLSLDLASRPRQLVRHALLWWGAAAVLITLAALLTEAVRYLTEAEPASIPLDSLHRFATYASAGFLAQIGARAADYASVLVSSLLAAVPQVMGLFVLGVLAGRLGWLVRPQRHRRVWRAATWIGLAALPLAAWGAWLNFATMLREPGYPAATGYVVQFFGSALACLYVAAFVRWRDRRPVAACIRWLAPAGRMPLTNYLLQSVAMGFFLSGWGLGWAPELGKAQLAALALAIVAVQLPLSRWWIGRFGGGPMERWWARVTYRPLSSSASTLTQAPR